MKVNSICVYTGSSFPSDPDYLDEAIKLGKEIARRGYRLVYGGGSRGLMGEIARSAKENGSYVIGVSPKRFSKGKDNPFPLDEYIIVDNMHQRKRRMFDEADAFITFPGGLGTIDEYAETATWKQIGFSSKPIVLLNFKGYYDPLLEQFDKMVELGFLKKETRDDIKSFNTIEEVFAYFDTFEPYEAPYQLV